MKYLIVLLMLLFTGCANIQASKESESINQYTETNRLKVEAGTMLRSTYYIGLYDLFAKSSFGDKAVYMQNLSELIDKSLSLESGKITQQEYDSAKRQANINTERHRQDKAERQQLLDTLNPPPRPVLRQSQPATPVNQLPKQTNCTSNRVGDTVYTNCQ